MSIVRKLLCGIFSPFEKLSQRLSPKFKKALFAICFFLIFCNRVSFGPLIWDNSFALTVGLSSILLFIVVALSITKETIMTVKIKLIYLIPLEIIGVSFFVNGVIFKVLGYIASGVIFCIVLPVFYIALKANGKIIVTSIGRGGSVFFVYFLILSLIIGPTIGRSYASYLGNQNILGLALIAMLACLMTELYTERIIWLKISAFALVCWNIVLCIYTTSRTALLAAVVMAVGFAFFAIYTAFRKKGIKAIWWTVKSVIVSAVAIALSMIFIFFLFTTVKIKVSEWFTVSPQVSQDTSLKDNMEFLEDRMEQGITEEGKAICVDVTTGRRTIWAQFIKEIGVLGHEKETLGVITIEGVSIEHYAHNSFLQMAYSNGIIAGAAMLFFFLAAAVDTVIHIVKSFKDKQLTYPIVLLTLLGCGFVFCAMAEAYYMVFTTMPATLIWLASGAVAVKD